MKKAYLIVSMSLPVIAVLCIGAAVREVIRGIIRDEDRGFLGRCGCF